MNFDLNVWMILGGIIGGGFGGGVTQWWMRQRLRDWFAGQALAGYCAVESTWANVSPSELVRACYRSADAMMIERTK